MADLPLDFGTLEQHGCFVGSHAVVILSDQDDLREVALQPDALLRGRILRPVHALPGRHREGGQAAERAALGRGAAGGAGAGDDAMRSICGLGQAAANPVKCGSQALPRGRVMSEHRSASPSMAARSRRAPGETHLAGRQPRRHRDPASLLPAGARLPPGRQLPRLHGRDRGRARAGRLLHPQAGRRHEGEDRDRARASRARGWCSSCCVADQPQRDDGARSRLALLALGRARRRRRQPLRRARARRQPDREPPGDGGQPRRLHPVQSVRARLPRGPGQRRHRHGRPRPSREDRLRLRRPDGRQHLRRLRRMRAGLPDRRADAGDVAGRARASRTRRPTARSTASAPIAASAASSPTRSRTTSSLSWRAATARPTRTGCASRAASASTTCTTPQRLTDAADPQARRAEARGRPGRPAPTRGRISARRAGRRRWSSPPPA